jgi:hypothetical protein
VGRCDTGGGGNRGGGGRMGTVAVGDCGRRRSGGNSGRARLEDAVVADMWALGPF